MRRVLIVRADAIGDAILWNGALPGLRTAFPEARIAMACRASVAPIYESAPEVDEVLPVDVEAIARDPAAAAEPAERLTAWGADLLLHPTRSRERHAEGLIARVAAGRKVALASDLANCTEPERAAFDAGYDEIIASPTPRACELDRHADVLRHFGVAGLPVSPRVVLTPADRAAAAGLTAGIGPYAVVSPSARWPIKRYPRWAEAIAAGLGGPDAPETVVAVGGPDASPGAEELRRGLEALRPGLRVVDLTGRAPLRTTIAVIAGARLCIGNDTFTAHAAASQGVSAVTVVGGGHLGRFLPYHPGSVTVAMPLACAGCDWRCVHDRAHCIRDVPAGAVADAVRLALAPGSGKPRVVLTGPPLEGPGGASLPAWLAPRVEAIPWRAPAGVALTVTR